MTAPPHGEDALVWPIGIAGPRGTIARLLFGANLVLGPLICLAGPVVGWLVAASGEGEAGVLSAAGLIGVGVLSTPFGLLGLLRGENRLDVGARVVYRVVRIGPVVMRRHTEVLGSGPLEATVVDETSSYKGGARPRFSVCIDAGTGPIPLGAYDNPTDADASRQRVLAALARDA